MRGQLDDEGFCGCIGVSSENCLITNAGGSGTRSLGSTDLGKIELFGGTAGIAVLIALVGLVFVTCNWNLDRVARRSEKKALKAAAETAERASAAPDAGNNNDDDDDDDDSNAVSMSSPPTQSSATLATSSSTVIPPGGHAPIITKSWRKNLVSKMSFLTFTGYTKNFVIFILDHHGLLNVFRVQDLENPRALRVCKLVFILCANFALSILASNDQVGNQQIVATCSTPTSTYVYNATVGSGTTTSDSNFNYDFETSVFVSLVGLALSIAISILMVGVRRVPVAKYVTVVTLIVGGLGCLAVGIAVRYAGCYVGVDFPP